MMLLAMMIQLHCVDKQRRRLTAFRNGPRNLVDCTVQKVEGSKSKVANLERVQVSKGGVGIGRLLL